MLLMLVVWRYILYQCDNKDISHMSRHHRYLGICEISLWSYGFPVNFSDETFNRLFKPIEISSVWLAPVADYNVDKIKKNDIISYYQTLDVISKYLTCSHGMTTYTKKLHDDVIKWKHFPRYWPFVRGIHRSPVNSPHKGQWRGALMFSLICVWINDWVNNREAGDLRRYRAHYDVTVMTLHISIGGALFRISQWHISCSAI